MPSCFRQTVQAFMITKAVMTRIIFSLHGVVCVWRVVVAKHHYWYWGLVSSLVLLIAEGIFTLKKKKGGEWKWFCPSVFLYLASTLPAIWFLELDLLERRIWKRDLVSTGQKTKTDHENTSILLGKISFHLPLEDWVKILEQVLLLVLIVGRWLLPKGQITREQLSQLLLVYIGMAADIIELFEAFKEEEVKYNLQLTIIILALWTASLLQFCFVMSAAKARKSRPSFTKQPSRSSLKDAQRCFTCRSEILSIMTTIILQDGSFLVLRMTLIFRYNVVSYTNIFFTAKNTLVNVLQLYRLVVLYAESFKLIKRQKSEPTFDEMFLVKAGILANQIAAKEEERKRRKILNSMDVATQFPESDFTGADNTRAVEDTGIYDDDTNVNAVVIENPMNSLDERGVDALQIIKDHVPVKLSNSKKSKRKICQSKLKTVGPEIMNMTMVYLNPAVNPTELNFADKSSLRIGHRLPHDHEIDDSVWLRRKGLTSGQMTGKEESASLDSNTAARESSGQTFKGVVRNVIDRDRGQGQGNSTSNNHCDPDMAGNKIEVRAEVNMPFISDNEFGHDFGELTPRDDAKVWKEDVAPLENTALMAYLKLPNDRSRALKGNTEKNRSGRKSKWRWRRAKEVKVHKKWSDLNQNSDEDVHFDLEIMSSGSDHS